MRARVGVCCLMIIVWGWGHAWAQAGPVFPAERSVWVDPDPKRSGEGGETSRLTATSPGIYNISNYHAHRTGFSPDGRYLLFVSNRNPERERPGDNLFLIDFDDGYRIKQIDVHAGRNRTTTSHAHWNNDGTVLYYYRTNANNSGGMDYYRLDVSQGIMRGEEACLTALDTVDSDIFGISPDGTRLAFSYAAGGGSNDPDIRAKRYQEQRIAYVPVTNRVTPLADGAMDLTGIVPLTTPQFDLSKNPNTRNLKVSWVNNDVIRYNHHDHHVDLVPNVANSHSHLLDTRYSPGDPRFDRIVAIGGHPLPHPNGKWYFSNDKGASVLDGNFRQGGLPGTWGLYDIITLKRFRLPVQWEVLGVHPDFSPDGNYVAFDYIQGMRNWITIHRLWSNEPPIRLVEHGMGWRTGPGEPFWHVNPHWSPDGTKLHFRSTAARPENEWNGESTDVFMVVFKRPDPVREVTARVDARTVRLGWKPALYHYETKEYRLHRAQSENGPYTRVGAAPQIATSFAANAGAADDRIQVKSTEAFPASGQVELAPLFSTEPSEVVSYRRKAADGFAELTRGAAGSRAAMHYRDTFVWAWPATDYFTDTVPSAGTWYYQVQSVEWSGLEGELSEPLAVTIGDDTRTSD